MRIITAAEAAREATAQLLAASKDYIVIGEGCPDPAACFETTRDLHKEFPGQVFDAPVSENGVTGVCIGAALGGLKPIQIHMRQDFLLYAMDQIVNNAAKWYSMFGGNGGNVPLVIKAFTGRGWGAGHQHSQNLEGLFAQIPGLKVVVPSNARNAKGLLIAAARDPNPVLVLEPRWIHHTTGHVPEEMYETPIGKAEMWHTHDNPLMTLISWGHMTSVCHRVCVESQIPMELVDLQTLSPIDFHTIRESLQKSGRGLVVADSWFGGIPSYIIAKLNELFCEVITIDDCYPSSSPALTKEYYPSPNAILRMICEALNREIIEIPDTGPHDIPDKSYTGPF